MLKPFFSYYGAKHAFSSLYPVPRHATIYEPFAGSAAYSCRWFERRVILFELDPCVAGVWDFLIKATVSEIQRLPIVVDDVDALRIPIEARWLIGFWLARGRMHPAKTPSAWMRVGDDPQSFWGEIVRSRIAAQVDSIRHWKIQQADYRTAPRRKATWFIDPPYSIKGRHYRCWKIDYPRLAKWCLERAGQLIVCETVGASWLPFSSLATVSTMRGKRRRGWSLEAIHHRVGATADHALIERPVRQIQLSLFCGDAC